MKTFVPVLILLGIVATLFISGCSTYDGGGSGFTQQDLELQRLQAQRARGF